MGIKLTIYTRNRLFHDSKADLVLLTSCSSFSVGDHGSDNSLPSMNPFLAALGPAFHKGYKHSTVSVDIYPMMCHILGLKPVPAMGPLVTPSVC